MLSIFLADRHFPLDKTVVRTVGTFQCLKLLLGQVRYKVVPLTIWLGDWLPR